MPRFPFRAALPLAACAILLTATAKAETPTACTTPAQLGATGAAMGASWPLLLDQTLIVVAVGSSSTEGIGASSPASTYPAQLERLLTARFPAVRISVINSGIGGESAAQNLARFDRDVLAHRPKLVIWQVGTNDVFQKIAPDSFKATIREGVARLRAAGADTLLMEPQYFPDETKHSGFLPMLQAVREVGAELGAPVLRRHDIMQHWVESRQLTVEAMLSPDGLHMTDASYRCLATVVADVIGQPDQSTLRVSGR